MSLTIHCKYKCFDSTVNRAEDTRQKFHFCRLPFAVNVKLNLSNNLQVGGISVANKHREELLDFNFSWISVEARELAIEI